MSRYYASCVGVKRSPETIELMSSDGGGLFITTFSGDDDMYLCDSEVKILITKLQEYLEWRNNGKETT